MKKLYVVVIIRCYVRNIFRSYSVLISVCEKCLLQLICLWKVYIAMQRILIFSIRAAKFVVLCLWRIRSLTIVISGLTLKIQSRILKVVNVTRSYITSYLVYISTVYIHMRDI